MHVWAGVTNAAVKKEIAQLLERPARDKLWLERLVGQPNRYALRGSAGCWLAPHIARQGEIPEQAHEYFGHHTGFRGVIKGRKRGAAPTREDADQKLGHIGAGFKDFTRIAASSPEMWRDICLGNRTAILKELDQY